MRTTVTLLSFCVAALMALGLVMLYSAKMTAANAAHLLLLQSLWAGLGLLVCGALAVMDYQHLRRLAWPLLGVTVVLLVLVFVPGIGKAAGGAHRWIKLPGFQVQPSELAKLALIIAAAAYGERFARQLGTFKHGLAWPAVLFGPVLALIFVEPDRGSTILLAGVLAVMFLVAGVRWHYFVGAALAGGAFIVFSVLNDPLRMRRVFAWLDVEANKAGVGYQPYQSMLAIGSGGWLGVGLGNGMQKMGYVPEHHTDFILAVIGEELGLVATLGVLLGFVLIVLCGSHIAIRARDTFGTLLATGVTFLIGCQAFINIGVVTNVLPNKGLALPFISYGGSSLVAMLAGVGLLISVARHARDREALPLPSNPLEPANPFAPKTA